MRKSRIKLDNDTIIAFCKQLNRKQVDELMPLIGKGISEYEFNQRVLIIRELQQLCEALKIKDCSWHELRGMVELLPNKPRFGQRTLFK